MCGRCWPPRSHRSFWAALWYSPLLFAKPWQREIGLSDEQLARGNMIRIFVLSFVLSLIAALVFAMFLGPRPPLQLGPRRGLRGRALLGREQLRHQLPVRAAQLQAVLDRRRLPHAAVHTDRPDPRALALTGGGVGSGSGTEPDPKPDTVSGAVPDPEPDPDRFSGSLRR